MDVINRQLIYTVSIGESGTMCVSEEELRFGAGCPVNIVPKERENGRDEVLKGSVLMSKMTNDAVLYTVNFGQRYENNIAAERVIYRKEIENATILSQSRSKERAADDSDEIRPKMQNTNPTEKNPEQEPNSTFPASINLRHDAKISDTTTFSGSANTGDETIALISSSNKRQKVGRQQNSMTSSFKGIRITLPMSLQQDFVSQRKLFFHLMRGRHGSGQGVIRLIQQESNCRVVINYDESIKNQGTAREMITIDIDHRNHRNSSDRVFLDARIMIEDSIMNFGLAGLPPIKEDGSKGRFLYEIAASCKGPHKPNASVSNAVRQLNPFDIDQKKCYMSILELPCIVNRLNTIFHGHFLLDSTVITEVNNLTGCTYKLVGGDFGSPAVIYCNPYIIVFGKHWAKVDHAVDILKRHIHDHRKGCACSFL